MSSSQLPGEMANAQESSSLRMDAMELLSRFSLSDRSLNLNSSMHSYSFSASDDSDNKDDAAATDAYIKHLKRKLKRSLKEEQIQLKRHMELLLVRRDLRAKVEKREVEEAISRIWKQKEQLDGVIKSL